MSQLLEPLRQQQVQLYLLLEPLYLERKLN
jgi:hypothetical protein